MRAFQKGFTLVEIAIVLVIIGLLLGGILKGQEMIVQAKIKNVMADFSGLSAAYHGYQDRYRAIPGDDPSAGTRWTGAASGDGNGVVEGTYNQTCPAQATPSTSNTAPNSLESCLWWDDLRRSGFVAGNGAQQPFNAAVGILGVQTGNGAFPPGPTMEDANSNGFVGLIACSANLPDKIAIAVDTQMDDGIPNSGTVRAALQTTTNPPVPTTADASGYHETGTNVYLLCRSM